MTSGLMARELSVLGALARPARGEGAAELAALARETVAADVARRALMLDIGRLPPPRRHPAQLRLLREAFDRLPAGPVSVPLATLPEAGASALGAAEGPRGAEWVWLRAGAGGTIDRLRLRSASFANWPVVAAAAPGNLVPDFPLINKSFELCYACTDR